MNEGIEHGEEAGVTPDEPPNARPARQRQDAMVHHVEEAATVTRPSGSYWCNQENDYVQGGAKKIQLGINLRTDGLCKGNS